jgi:hypothetical protein
MRAWFKFLDRVALTDNMGRISFEPASGRYW